MRSNSLLLFVVGLIVLLCAVLFSLYSFYTNTQHYLAQVNPILALPGIEIEQLDKTIRSLESSLVLLENYYEPEEFKIIAETLYPIEFLATLPTTERTRRAVLEQPTLRTITAYHQSVDMSLEKYQAALTSYSNQYASAQNRSVYLLDGKISIEHLSQVLKELQLQVAHLQQMNSDRSRCFWLPLQKHCLYTPYVLTQSISNLPIAPSSEFVPFITSVWSDNEPVTLTTLTDAACNLGNRQAQYAWLETTSRINNLPMIKSTIIDNLYLYDLRAQTDNPYYTRQLEQGYLYDLQPTNPYMCFDFAADIASLATLNYFVTELERNPLFLSSQHSAWSDMADLEMAVVTTGLLSDVSLRQYTARIREIITTTDTDTLRQELGDANYNRLLDYYLIALTNSPALLPTLGLIDDMMATNEYILEVSKLDLDFLFIARSYLTGTLLFHNQSLILEPVSLYSDSSQATPENFNLTSYESIRSTYSLSELLPLVTK